MRTTWRRVMKTKLIIFLVSLTFMSFFSISSALFADEFSEFESVVKSVKMACFYEIRGNHVTINYRYDGTNLFYSHVGSGGEGKISLNEIKQKPGKNIFIWKWNSIFGEIKTFIDFENTSAIETYGGGQKHVATCMPQ